MCENRIRRGDSPVASESQIESTAHAVPADGRVDWSGEALYRGHKRLAYAREFASLGPGQSRDLAQVGSRREESAAPSNDQRFRPARQVMEPIGQCQYTIPRQAIGAVIRAQTQQPNAVMLLERKKRAW